jgi:hypothetical protein
VGVLDDVALTLVAGDYCGRVCGDDRAVSGGRSKGTPRTDATVPVYSQLMLPCPSACPSVPGSVYIPKGLLPRSVVRKTFPTVHSTFDAARLGLPERTAVSKNAAAIDYLVKTLTMQWQAAGVPGMQPPS